MEVIEQKLKGDEYNVYMKIPTYMMDELMLENGDWLKIRVGSSKFALVKTNEKRGVQIKSSQVRFPQQFSHRYRVRTGDRVSIHMGTDRISFGKVR